MKMISTLMLLEKGNISIDEDQTRNLALHFLASDSSWLQFFQLSWSPGIVAVWYNHPKFRPFYGRLVSTQTTPVPLLGLQHVVTVPGVDCHVGRWKIS